MKAVILAGGLGTRLAEETDVRPKPMVEIGGMPILWHILKMFSHHGVQEFFVALGYKGDYIKRWFVDYTDLGSNLVINTETGDIQRHQRNRENWVVHLVDTGIGSNTGGRVGRLQEHIGNQTFIVTYGDGVANVDIGALLSFHRRQGKIATVTAVRPPARYGILTFDGDLITEFTEKPEASEGWINGGFLVFEPAIFDFIQGDSTFLEADVLEQLAQKRQLAAFRHDGFWQCMDTLRDKRLLDQLWQQNRAPWKIWA